MKTKVRSNFSSPPPQRISITRAFALYPLLPKATSFAALTSSRLLQTLISSDPCYEIHEALCLSTFTSSHSSSYCALLFQGNRNLLRPLCSHKQK